MAVAPRGGADCQSTYTLTEGLMASLIWDKSKGGKTARIQFVIGDRRPAVRLGRVPV